MFSSCGVVLCLIRACIGSDSAACEETASDRGQILVAEINDKDGDNAYNDEDDDDPAVGVHCIRGRACPVF